MGYASDPFRTVKQNSDPEEKVHHRTSEGNSSLARFEVARYCRYAQGYDVNV